VPPWPDVDVSAQMLWAEQPFPVGGSAVNGFLRWGGGVAIPLGSHSFEVGYRLAHLHAERRPVVIAGLSHRGCCCSTNKIDQRTGVRRNPVAAPCNVKIRAAQ
jgi:hypothetical protein